MLISPNSTNPATIRSMMRSTPTNAPQNSIRQMSTSRPGFNFFAVGRAAGCRYTPAPHCHKTCTLMPIKRQAQLALPDHSGVLRRLKDLQGLLQVRLRMAGLIDWLKLTHRPSLQILTISEMACAGRHRTPDNQALDRTSI